MAAVVLWRFRFPGKTAGRGHPGAADRGAGNLHGRRRCWSSSPACCRGRRAWPWPLNLGAIIIAHISFSFPFVATVVRARLASFNRELEEAAKDLGASEWRDLHGRARCRTCSPA